MQPFLYIGAPSRVLFGSGTLGGVAEEVRMLSCRRALVLCGPNQVGAARRIADHLGPLGVGVFNEAAMHTPVSVTERAMEVVQQSAADCVVAFGGGSAIGLGKAIALRTDLPQISIPTTYAGSEATSILGETQDGLKTTLKDSKVLPEVIIYDVDLTLSLPPHLSAASGMNAIAHAVEGLYAQNANPVLSLIAEEGIRALAAALPRIVQDPGDRDARSDALYGAWLCGVVLGSVGMSLHHKLCHTLGGSFGLPHAETHAVVLPHAAAYNADAAPEAMDRIARALGVGDAPTGLYDLAVSLSAPTALKDIGMLAAGLDKATEIATSNPYWNPRPIERAALGALLEDAFYGRRPAPRRL